MPLIIPPGFLHAVYELKLDVDPELMVITCGHEIDSASGASGAQAADDLFNAFATTMVPVWMSNRYSFVGVTVYIGNDGPNIVEISTEDPVAGAATGEVLPNNTALLIRKRTDLAGRRGRGRVYLPGIPEAQVGASGDVSGAYVEAMQDAADDWYEALTSAVGARYYPPVVLHRSEGAGEEPPPTPVARFVVEDRVATQRKRMRP